MQDVKKINFEMITPSEDLADFVQAIWFAENLENDEELPFKILNDCGTTIVMNFGSGLTYEQGNQSFESAQEASTMGPSKDLLKMTFKGPIHTIGIHFFPATGHHFFNVPMNELSNKFLKTTSQHYIDGELLYSKVGEIIKRRGKKEEIINTIEVHLKSLLENSYTKCQPVLINILKAIHLNNELTLIDLSDIFSIGKRDIQRLFKTYVGVSPNVYIRLNKVKDAKIKIANGEFESLTKLSMDSGYFDQAHFIRDFKSFMEETPKKYHRLKNLK